MPAPLISHGWRRPALGLAATAAVVLTVFAISFRHGASTSFDTWTFRELYAHVGAGAAATLLGFSEPALSISLCAVVAVLAAILRRWDIAALAVIGPGLTVLVTKVVLKPLLDRELVLGEFRVTGVFPSGHESAVASTACVLAIVAFQLPLSRGVRAVVLPLLGVWAVVAALGLVRNFWHYATDTIGAICLALAVVLTAALVIDRYGATLRPRAPADAGRLTQLTERS